MNNTPVRLVTSALEVAAEPMRTVSTDFGTVNPMGLAIQPQVGAANPTGETTHPRI